jgi:hypothetical protein
MTTITLAGSTTPAVAALAQVLWDSLDTTTIRTGGNGASWPFAPDSLDFSGQGKCTLTIDGNSGGVTFAFQLPTAPTIRGTLDFALLEAQLTTAPNYLDYDTTADMGPAATITVTSTNFTRQKSGIVFITAEFDGTQSAQDEVSVALYRDHGLSGEVQLSTWHVSPGGVGSFNWSGHIHDTDVLPDLLPHTYTWIATGSGGSNLSLAKGAGAIILFELGGPG